MLHRRIASVSLVRDTSLPVMRTAASPMQSILSPEKNPGSEGWSPGLVTSLKRIDSHQSLSYGVNRKSSYRRLICTATSSLVCAVSVGRSHAAGLRCDR